MRDWTTEEKKSITDLLKKVPAADRPAIRDTVKEMQADEAISYIKGLKASEKPFKPLKASEGVNLPIQSKTSQNKPVKVSKDAKGQVKAKQAVKTPLKASSDHPQILPRVDGDIIRDNFDIETIKQDIQAFIRAWCDNNNIDDLRKAEQPIFQALCTDIGKSIFKPSDILRSTKLVPSTSASPLTNNYAYDLDKVILALDLYQYICNIYNKVITVWGAAAFCGVSRDFFYDNAEKLTRLGCDMEKNSEISLAESIVSGRRSPVGALSWLNHFHGWSGAGTNRTEVRETTVVYPVLVDINKSDRETIPDKQSR